MEERTLQVTGGSSYVITLPKEWAKKLITHYKNSLSFSENLKVDTENPLKGLRVQIKEKSDGRLIINPFISPTKSQRTKSFNVKNIDASEYLFRCLIAAYIGGNDKIVIKSLEEEGTPFVRNTVRKFIKSTIGQEIVEESNDKIVIKDLLNPEELPFNKAIVRMYRIAKSMYQDALSVLSNKDKRLAEDVLKRDEDIDRLYWLISRRYTTILARDVWESSETSISLVKVTNILQVAKTIERIGDHSVNIVKNVLIINEELKNTNTEVTSDILDRIDEASRLALSVFIDAIHAFLESDLDKSNGNFEKVKQLNQLCDTINDLAAEKSGRIAISLAYIVESVQRVGEYASDISESSINYIIDELE